MKKNTTYVSSETTTQNRGNLGIRLDHAVNTSMSPLKHKVTREITKKNNAPSYAEVEGIVIVDYLPLNSVNGNGQRWGLVSKAKTDDGHVIITLNAESESYVNIVSAIKADNKIENYVPLVALINEVGIKSYHMKAFNTNGTKHDKNSAVLNKDIGRCGHHPNRIGKNGVPSKMALVQAEELKPTLDEIIELFPPVAKEPDTTAVDSKPNYKNIRVYCRKADCMVLNTTINQVIIKVSEDDYKADPHKAIVYLYKAKCSCGGTTTEQIPDKPEEKPTE